VERWTTETGFISNDKQTVKARDSTHYPLLSRLWCPGFIVIGKLEIVFHSLRLRLRLPLVQSNAVEFI